MGSRGAVIPGTGAGVGAAPARGLSRTEHVVHTVAIVGFAVQAITGLGGRYIVGEVSGWLLFVHMLGAPLFVVGLAGTAVMWAERCRLRVNPVESGGLSLGQQLMFWIGILVSLAVVLPMLAAMLPIFGYAGQQALIDIHRISAILLLAAMIVHTVVSLAARRAKR